MTGEVTAAILPGWYLVRDQAGRLHRAASQEVWRKGERVTVVGGVIIGRSGQPPKITIYEV